MSCRNKLTFDKAKELATRMAKGTNEEFIIYKTNRRWNFVTKSFATCHNIKIEWSTNEILSAHK